MAFWSYGGIRIPPPFGLHRVKVRQFENTVRFKKCGFKSHLSKLGLGYRCTLDVVMHSNKQTGPY